MKLKLCINVHDISLFINGVFFSLSLPMCFRCYGNLKFPYIYNGKSQNWHLFLCYCRYFDKGFSEMFLEKSSTNHMNFVQITVLSKSLILIGGRGNRKAKFLREKKIKSLLLGSNIAFIAVHSGERCG